MNFFFVLNFNSRFLLDEKLIEYDVVGFVSDDE